MLVVHVRVIKGGHGYVLPDVKDITSDETWSGKPPTRMQIDPKRGTFLQGHWLSLISKLVARKRDWSGLKES